MPTVEFGLVLPAEFPDDLGPKSFLADADRALAAVTGHFDSAWVVDHLQSAHDRRLEAFVTLSYMAARHPELRVGHAVLCQSFRNPGLVAKMAATLQLLTGGRYILGIGAGGNAEEYAAYGFAFPPAIERVQQLDEAIQIIKALWHDPTVTFKGQYHHVVDAHCEPRPLPVPPIMIGAFRPRMLRLVARHADWWNVSSIGPARYAKMASELERACEDAGRDPASLKRTWIGGFACAENRRVARQWAGERFSAENDFDDFGFVGTAAEIAEQMLSLIDQGVDYFMLDAADFPKLDGLERLMGDVLPQVRG